MEKISVIIPVYNAEKVVKKCLNSIINQYYKNIEIIIVNDGSNDNTLSIIKSLKDKRIKVINKQNGGVSSARNVGINNSTGKYIVFVDADDYLPKNAISTLYDKLNKDIDFVIGNYYIPQYSRKGTTKQQIISKSERIQCKIFNKNYPDNVDDMGNPRTVWGKLYKLDIIKNNGILFDEKVKLFEDGIFNLEYCKYIKKASLISDIVYYYNIEENSAVHKFYKDKYKQDVYKINLIVRKRFNSGIYSEPFKLFVFELYVDFLKNYIKTNEKNGVFSKDKIYHSYINKLNFKYLSKNLKIIYILYKLKMYFIINIIIKVVKK